MHGKILLLACAALAATTLLPSSQAVTVTCDASTPEVCEVTCVTAEPCCDLQAGACGCHPEAGCKARGAQVGVTTASVAFCVGAGWRDNDPTTTTTWTSGDTGCETGI